MYNGTFLEAFLSSMNWNGNKPLKLRDMERRIEMSPKDTYSKMLPDGRYILWRKKEERDIIEAIYWQDPVFDSDYAIRFEWMPFYRHAEYYEGRIKRLMDDLRSERISPQEYGFALGRLNQEGRSISGAPPALHRQ